MLLEHFLIPEVNETNVYLLACRETKKAALIDAGGFDDRVLEMVEGNGLQVGWILITHDHYDHTAGLASYQDAFPGCKIVAGGGRAGETKAHRARDGEIFQVGSLTVRVLAIPGHTSDSTAYHFSRSEGPVPVSVVFSGDVLFAGSVGGAMGRAHEEELRGIREKLFVLPEATPIYPGHGPATTVGIEKHHNPFFN